jgi:hypothetical protein
MNTSKKQKITSQPTPRKRLQGTLKLYMTQTQPNRQNIPAPG